jgi:hypothetical protein
MDVSCHGPFIIIIIIIIHPYAGYSQFYVWNKPCFWGI